MKTLSSVFAPVAALAVAAVVASPAFAADLTLSFPTAAAQGKIMVAVFDSAAAYGGQGQPAKVALLDRDALDLPLVVFVSIKTSQHDEAWLEAFKKASALPEVVEFYRMSGEVDYLLKVLVKDIAAYDRFYRRLIAIAPLCDVSSSFAMEQIKFTTALPL